MSPLLTVGVSAALLAVASLANAAESGSTDSGQIVVAESLEDVGKSLEDRAPASLDSTIDGASHSYAIKGVVAYDHIAVFSNGVHIVPYVGLDRQTALTAADDVDDLSVGARAEGYIGLVPISGTVSWITDSADLDSSLTKAEMRAQFPNEWLYRLFGCSSRAGFCNGAVDDDAPGRFKSLLRMSAFFVADYVDVADPGHKVALLTTASYARVGYDLNAALRLGRSLNEKSLWLTASFKQREDVSGHAQADVHLFDAGLELRWTDATPYSLRLSYERGRTLDTFTPVDTVKLGLGLKY